MAAELHAKVVLKHAEDEDVSGCHLHQKAAGATNVKRLYFEAQEEPPAAEFRTRNRRTRERPYWGWEVLNDYHRHMKSKSYHGWWFEDWPGFAIQGRRNSLPKQIAYWWQAEVYVEETPKVKNWYGFSVKVTNWRKSKTPTVAKHQWKDEKKQLPWNEE